MEFINEENIDELIEAQAHIWTHTFHFIKSMALKCAIQLGIPDTISRHGQPITLSELAVSLELHPTKTHHLYRLMRLLVNSGFFTLQNHHGREAYQLTTASRLLLKNSPFDSRPFISMILDPVIMEPYNHLSPFLRNDDPTAFVTAFGETLWGFAGHERRLSGVFNEAMASDSLVVGRAVSVKCKKVFEGLSSMVDVGGGTGTMTMAIAEAFPELRCTVLDLTQVVGELHGLKNLSFVGGDMFQFVPPADAILLKWILHDWPDEECVKILKKCKEAIMTKEKKGNKVIIIDMVMGNDASNKWREAELLFDMEMMACVSGQERNEKQWAQIFFSSGFTAYAIHPVLGPRSLIELFP